MQSYFPSGLFVIFFFLSIQGQLCIFAKYITLNACNSD